MTQKELQNHNFKPILKESSTDNLYQSAFLPIFQDAETRIKKLIFIAFLTGMAQRELWIRLKAIIESVDGKVPKELKDKSAYLNGLRKRTTFYVARYYTAPKNEFVRVKNRFFSRITGVEKPTIDNPKQLMEISKRPELWGEAKGTPYIHDYTKQVYKRMDELARTPLTTHEDGKKPISLWQKAELDVRYDKQMNMLNTLVDTGVELAWTSSHADASKRCEKWQGKLMSLTEHATMTGFRVRKEGTNWVYSLTDIMAQKDKYGYHNNIICGFNCRHKLIPYDPKKEKPTQYSKEEVAMQRNIETHIRELEREIRAEKTRLLLYKQLGEKKIVKNLENRVKMLVEHYKRFCERHGYAWFEYRIRIREGMNEYI